MEYLILNPYFAFQIIQCMSKKELTIPQQVEQLLDGRTQRWLALEIKMPESNLSKRMKGEVEFSEEEIESINTRLNGKIKLKKSAA